VRGGEPLGAGVLALLEPVRRPAHHLGPAQAADVLDERLEQRTADAAAAQVGLDGREDEGLVEVVVQREPREAAADHPVPVEDPERVGALARRGLAQRDGHLLEGLEGVPGAAVLHLGAPADLVEAAELGVVVDVDRAGLHAAEPRRPEGHPSPGLLRSCCTSGCGSPLPSPTRSSACCATTTR
jgi:hypothetical protein